MLEEIQKKTTIPFQKHQEACLDLTADESEKLKDEIEKIKGEMNHVDTLTSNLKECTRNQELEFYEKALSTRVFFLSSQLEHTCN